ncbi:acetyl/propionyl/methylcrotonyl-CoA carboxylase subunit alpha [Nocardioides sp. AX2bis]|uniref:acetyl/propionyl/methylcrotonyl-CoA carboxylase subunit alpha n=1 Tax=Nocardioides sp. AX2bis TaxID=2653157 RepID=UPI0012F24122|nr:biotin carboxylase N-terminal domain-containing protein [Nocardioides sp. AX2bis]VXB87890.1 Biotin carboxylase / Biotin carboxyl carrier protein [Nocardioides sp. AX2bis]
MNDRRELVHGAFDSVLVANRGEIAVRVLQAARDEGLRAIAVHSDVDADALHVRTADEAHALHGVLAKDTYLHADKLIDVALAAGAQAVHPGYGFLSESADFAEAVIAAGLVWIGPSPRAIDILGDKVEARAVARSVGAPLAPGTEKPVATVAEIELFVEAYGMPIAIKAAFGGGGRGLRVVRDRASIAEDFDSATREAVAAFGRGECFVERYLEHPRHVEAQLLADRYGDAVVVGTRDCSLQRRHQKLVEEAPAPFLTEEQTTTIVEASVAIARSAGYVGAGTAEFLVGDDGVISFLEVNTRLQVEHPVTEETTGVDLVSEQFAIARGEHLRVRETPVPRGHSIELRINAEDPGRAFAPSPGRVTTWDVPRGPGIRIDTGVVAGSVVTEFYDSMLGKLVVSGKDRATVLARTRRALDELRIVGVATVLPLDRAILAHPDFTGGGDGFSVHTGWIEEHLDELLDGGAGGGSFDVETPDAVDVLIGRQVHRVALPGLATLGERAEPIRQSVREQVSPAEAGDDVRTPMQGTVVRVAVNDGDQVEEGDLIGAVEAMKMENAIRAHRSGTVSEVSVVVGDVCAQGSLVCRIEANESPGPVPRP